MLDRSFAAEIRKANGDGALPARFALIRQVRSACSALSTPAVLTTFGAVLREHGRVPVALCVAATIHVHREWFGGSLAAVQWAEDVLSCWTNRSPHAIADAYIRDNLHYTRILEYAGNFIRLTSD